MVSEPGKCRTGLHKDASETGDVFPSKPPLAGIGPVAAPALLLLPG